MVTLGLDIGGTKTAALVTGPDGRVLGEASVATDVSSPEAVIRSATTAAIKALAIDRLSLADVSAAGAGIPGQVDPASGTVRLAVNLNFFAPYNLGDALQEALGVPVALENDVRVATLGAYEWLRSRESVTSLAYLSIGTGIAAGIILDGRLYRGAHGMAGEIGHIPVDPLGPRCACGGSGCLEAVASGPAIAAYANGLLAAAHDTTRWTTFDTLTLAAEGNAIARQTTERTGYFLSRAIYLLMMTYDVEKVILGGGVTGAGESFRRPLEKALADLRRDSSLAAAMLLPDKVFILPPNYNAGAHGAVLLAQEALAAAVR